MFYFKCLLIYLIFSFFCVGSSSLSQKTFQSRGPAFFKTEEEKFISFKGTTDKHGALWVSIPTKIEHAIMSRYTSEGYEIVVSASLGAANYHSELIDVIIKDFKSGRYGTFFMTLRLNKKNNELDLIHISKTHTSLKANVLKNLKWISSFPEIQEVITNF